MCRGDILFLPSFFVAPFEVPAAGRGFRVKRVAHQFSFGLCNRKSNRKSSRLLLCHGLSTGCAYNGWMVFFFFLCASLLQAMCLCALPLLFFFPQRMLRLVKACTPIINFLFSSLLRNRSCAYSFLDFVAGIWEPHERVRGALCMFMLPSVLCTRVGEPWST